MSTNKSNEKPIKMAMSLEGAKSVKIEEDDAIIFTMEHGPPIELRFVMPSVHNDQQAPYETPMAKSGPGAKPKVGFFSPESTKTAKSNKSDVHMASPPPFMSPADSSMGSPSPFKQTGGPRVYDAYDQGLTQETTLLDTDSLCLDCEENPKKSVSEMLAAFDLDE
ncbi:hypothetical protein SEMRO_711_G191210.1 [Seminavis robusta]|uniref:Uncharacterized protein n=1 Tax=Seminavis robusta TaxID=568900 RepID=A0A9N8E633_9STRA|nr:hypothetical protein SEMRO_711_G191210.1 [Seminavis robusta]|eukprot:Sro711_g191210.1 n/a (165) ;mRNA; f:27950-28444